MMLPCPLGAGFFPFPAAAGGAELATLGFGLEAGGASSSEKDSHAGSCMVTVMAR